MCTYINVQCSAKWVILSHFANKLMTKNDDIEELGIHDKQSSDRRSFHIDPPTQICCRRIGMCIHDTLPGVHRVENPSESNYSEVDLLFTQPRTTSRSTEGEPISGYTIRSERLPGGIIQLDEIIRCLHIIGANFRFDNFLFNSITITGPYSVRFLRSLIRTCAPGGDETDSQTTIGSTSETDSEWSF